MKRNPALIGFYFGAAALEGLAGLIYLLSIPPDPKNSLFLGFSAARLGVAFLMLSVTAAAAWMYGLVHRRRDFAHRTALRWLGRAQFNALFSITAVVILACALILSVGTYLWNDAFVVYLQRLRPLFFWLALVALQTLLMCVFFPPQEIARPSQPLVRPQNKPWGITRRGALLLGGALLAGLGVRFYLAAAYPGNYDQFSFEIVVDALQTGKPLYFAGRYNYAPLWAWTLFLLQQGAQWSGLPLHIWSRGFLALVDGTNAVLVGLIVAQTNRQNTRLNLPACIAYLLNPLAWLLVGYHGQFETLALLPLLAAVYHLQRYAQSTINLWWVWTLGTLALLIKHITLFGVWMLFFYAVRQPRRAFLLLLCSLGVFLLSFVPYLPQERDAIFYYVFSYQSFFVDYGLSTALPLWLHRLVFLGGLAGLPLLAKYAFKMPVSRAMTLCFVAQLTLVYGFSEQALILPLAWGSLALFNPAYWLYTLLAAGFIANSPNNLNLNGSPVYFDPQWLRPTWWALVIWLVSLPFEERVKNWMARAVNAFTAPQQ